MSILCYNLLMSSKHFHRVLGGTTITLGVLSLAIVSYAFSGHFVTSAPMEGRLVSTAQRKDPPWKIITPEMVMTGTTIPSDTNVIFELPTDMRPILRDVLLGSTDSDVRYWGYCLPDDYQKEQAVGSDRLPGKVFLSNGEQAARDEAYQQSLREHFTISKNLTEEDLNQMRTRPKGLVENEFLTFDPGSICYIMTSRPLALGTDDDDDGANCEVERVNHTDPHIPDTDGDGLHDGCEIFGVKSSPTLRDTDGDGLIDGMEDADHNCHYTAGDETNPLSWDTDHDGIPDGLMKMGDARKTRLMGEDKNLNGVVDPGESDPRKWSTVGNEISDGERYWQCVFTQGTNC